MNRTALKINNKTDADNNAAKAAPVLNVEKLFNGLREVRLLHCSEEYRLTLTKNNKLILTK